MLDGLDALVFDVQDAGARFYTYASTMAYTMEAAAQRRIDFYVLDRPSARRGAVQGPLMDADLRSFTGYYPLPVRHGMTIGELAQLFNAEAGIGAHLHVIAMKGYQRREGTTRPDCPGYHRRRTCARSRRPCSTRRSAGRRRNVSVGRGTRGPFNRSARRGSMASSSPPISIGARFAASPSRQSNSRRRARHIRVAFAAASASFDRSSDPGFAGIGNRDRKRAGAPVSGAFQAQRNLGMIGARWVLQLPARRPGSTDRRPPMAERAHRFPRRARQVFALLMKR